MTKMIKIPSNAKTVEIDQKQKRGRPAATKKALEHQPAPVTPVPISVKPIKSSIAVTKRGRPAATKKALEHQPAPVEPGPVKKRKATYESQKKTAKHAKIATPSISTRTRSHLVK